LSFQDVNKLQLLLKGGYQFRLLFLQLLVFCQQLVYSLMLLFASILSCVSMCENENFKKKKEEAERACVVDGSMWPGDLYAGNLCSLVNFSHCTVTAKTQTQRFRATTSLITRLGENWTFVELQLATFSLICWCSAIWAKKSIQQLVPKKTSLHPNVAYSEGLWMVLHVCDQVIFMVAI